MNSSVAGPSVAAGRAGAISVAPASSRSAELLYEPSEIALARSINGCGFELRSIGGRSGAALRWALRPPTARWGCVGNEGLPLRSDFYRRVAVEVAQPLLIN